MSHLEAPLLCLFNPLQDGSLANQTFGEISAPHDLGDCQHNLSVCVCVCVYCVCVYVYVYVCIVCVCVTYLICTLQPRSQMRAADNFMHLA